jgi:tetratricopeptide (TPR) repeat protein
LAWLRGQLARHGFDIVIVSGGQDPRGAIEKAAPTITPGDVVLVHVSGRLSGRDELAFGGDRTVALSALPELFAARSPSSLSFIAELTCDHEASVAPADCLADVASALATEASGHDVVVALRPGDPNAARFQATRAGFGAPELSADRRPPGVLLDAMHRYGTASAASTAIMRSRAGANGFPMAPPPFEAPLAAPPALEAPAFPQAAEPPAGDPEESVNEAVAAAAAQGDWRCVAELRLEGLAAIADPRAQVRELVAIARVLQAELADSEGAIVLLERARRIEPTRTSVLRALRRGYEAQGRWADALDALESLAALAESGSERAEYRAAQARIAAEHVGDTERARAFLHEALLADPQQAEALALLGQLDAASDGAPSGSAYAAAAVAAFDPASYASAFAAYDAQGQIDGAFLAALALEDLGAAADEHRAVLERWRTVGPVRARASLDAWGWEQLRAPGHDDVIADLFAAIEGAAVAARIDEMREARRLPALDRDKRLPETSTASIVRSFQWAARFLVVACPALYALEEAPGMAVIHAAEPSTALGQGVLSGPTAKDLAFLAGRHLTYYRPEYHVLLYYPTREDLTALLFAAVQVVNGDSPTAPPSVRALRARLERRLGPTERGALREGVRRLNERGGQAKVGAWMRGVELTAGRAGLFLCGDLATATRMMRAESRQVAELSTEERLGDLLGFCASAPHLALRTRFVATSAESVMPPAGAVIHRTAAQ